MPSCNSFSRRQFGLALAGLPFSFGAAAAEFAVMPWNGPAKVARAYLAGPRAHWPKPTLDIAQEVAEIEVKLAEVQRKHVENVQFTGGDVLMTAEEVGPWLAKTGPVDGVLAIPVTQPCVPFRAMADQATAPVLFFFRPYASHSWGSVGSLQKSGKRVDLLATTSYGDLDPYMRIFRTAHHLKHSKVLVGATTPKGRQEAMEAYSRHFGTAFRLVGANEFKDAFAAADDRQARKEADEFVKGALRVVEPSQKEIHDGLRFYLALKEMLRRDQANAITIDCFGTLAANTLPGYPCIAFSKFNDAGMYGVCEGDIASTMTQMLVTSYAEVPGFVSDPVFDTSRNEVIHAHCVAATKMKGIHSAASPYIIRNHLETNEGAVLQVLMPSQETITCGRFTGADRFLISTAEVTGPVDSDRGCRTQIRTRVSNAQKWLQNYSAGLHRVIFYGDHSQAVERMGRLLGFEVVQEM